MGQVAVCSLVSASRHCRSCQEGPSVTAVSGHRSTPLPIGEPGARHHAAALYRAREMDGLLSRSPGKHRTYHCELSKIICYHGVMVQGSEKRQKGSNLHSCVTKGTFPERFCTLVKQRS